MWFLGESREVGRLVCLALIVSGVVGLKLFTKTAGWPVRATGLKPGARALSI